MKIYIHYTKEDWIIDRLAQEFKNRWPAYTTSDPSKADIIWSLSPAPLVVNKDIPLITTIHHVDVSKYDPRLYSLIDKGTTHYHTFCSKTKEFMESKSEFTKGIDVLPYWVNRELWKEESKEECQSLLKLPKDKYIIGSFQRDTEGSDLISPKLSKGPDRFCDYVEKLQSKRGDVHVLLGGWRRQYVISRLEEANIPYTYLERPPTTTINTMYNACDLYVVGSRYEGGPQAILECAITKTPIISTDVGIASDILVPMCIIDIEKDMYTPTTSDIEYAYIRASKLCLDNDLGYIDFFKRL